MASPPGLVVHSIPYFRSLHLAVVPRFQPTIQQVFQVVARALPVVPMVAQICADACPATLIVLAAGKQSPGR